jgi:hypothetical protein
MATLPTLLGGPPADSVAVLSVITGAFRALGVLASGEAPSAAEASDALGALNDMLDSWANERLVLFGTLRSAYALTAGRNPHTIGSAGDFDTTRPVRIDRASLVLAGQANTETPLNLLSDAEWQATQGKAGTGQPLNLWVQTGFPLTSLWLNPVPVAADTLVLYSWQQLGRFSVAGDTVALPPGYSRALRLNLALELAPEYGVEPSPTLLTNAGSAKAELKRVNSKPSYLRSDAAVLGQGAFNLISGDKG